MFVLADIEWITNADGHYCPIQLGAIRVDKEWNEIARFHSFIRPKDAELHDWGHVAYTGGSATEFLKARNAYSVLESFQTWLSEDDMILWWYKESDIVFKKLHSLILKTKFAKKTICICDYVYAFLRGEPNSRGTAYRIAEAREIFTNPKQQHYSINDAVVMQKLMKKIAYPQPDLLKPVVKTQIEKKLSKSLEEFPYRYDPATNRIHLRDCPLLPKDEGAIIGIGALKAPLRKGFKPCECCKKEYTAAFRERNIDVLERTQYTYAFSKDSKVFHKYSCGIMLSVKDILGTRKYETVIKTGRMPCKLCKPSPDDVYRPLPQQVKIDRLQKKTKRMVSKEDAKAILRQRVAAEERNRKLGGETLTQQERNDVFTLTQPRFAFWVGQGYRTFHLRHCAKLQKVSNLRGFSAYKDAVGAGFAPCRKCKPTAKHDVKISIPITNRIREDEKIEDLEALCQKAGYSHHREGAYLHMETPVGKWRIHVTESPVKLDHINLVMTPNEDKYHEQPRLFLSFRDVFDYIKRHDEKLERAKSDGDMFSMPIEE